MKFLEKVNGKVLLIVCGVFVVLAIAAGVAMLVL